MAKAKKKPIIAKAPSTAERVFYCALAVIADTNTKLDIIGSPEQVNTNRAIEAGKLLASTYGVFDGTPISWDPRENYLVKVLGISQETAARMDLFSKVFAKIENHVSEYVNIVTNTKMTFGAAAATLGINKNNKNAYRKVLKILSDSKFIVDPDLVLSSKDLEALNAVDSSFEYFKVGTGAPQYLGFNLLDTYSGYLGGLNGVATVTLQDFRDRLMFPTSAEDKILEAQEELQSFTSLPGNTPINQSVNPPTVIPVGTTTFTRVEWDIISVASKQNTPCKITLPGAEYLAERTSKGKIPTALDLTQPSTGGDQAHGFGLEITGDKVNSLHGVSIISLVKGVDPARFNDAITSYCSSQGSSYVHTAAPLTITEVGTSDVASAIAEQKAAEGIQGALYSVEKDWSIRMYFVAGLSLATSSKKVNPVWGTYNGSGWSQFIDEFKFGVNPDTWSVQASKKVTVYKTLNRVVEEHYGDDLDTITFSGSSLSVFLGNDSEGPLKSNYKHTGVLKNGLLADGEAKKLTAAYKNMQELSAFIRSNGLSYYGLSWKGQAARPRRFFRDSAKKHFEAPRHPRYGMIQARFIVAIEYDHTKYLGHFESFDITEDAEKPYSYVYNATFKVEKSIMI